MTGRAVVRRVLDRYRESERTLGLRLAAYVAAHMGGLALLAWATGRPLLLPSLGPSAYILASRKTQTGLIRETVGGQAIGAIAAYASVLVLVGPLEQVRMFPALTTVGLLQVVAVVVAVVTATVGMSVFRVLHAPAYATVLIFALGIPQGAMAVPIFLAAVVGMVAVHEVLRRVVSVVPAE
ncbi:HPP family protein [Halospeciosus flavus]|uniref:HPP family protein n=1 Tax=Halospeciosus flavus TaxID=3032283 RepID=A0ABD5Z8L1_9EURY|nr:HPP family protein [Halospeciosus flavus]